MGMFSYICSKTDEQILSDERSVTLYFIKEGVIQEVMSGPYNGYGSVNSSDQTTHKVLLQGVLVDVTVTSTDGAMGEWTCDDWGKLVSLKFEGNSATGFVAVKGSYDPSYAPVTVSEDDPNQGWPYDDDETCAMCGECSDDCVC